MQIQIQINWLLQTSSTLFANTGHVVFSKRRVNEGFKCFFDNVSSEVKVHKQGPEPFCFSKINLRDII